jgi:hypothetical protein
MEKVTLKLLGKEFGNCNLEIYLFSNHVAILNIASTHITLKDGNDDTGIIIPKFPLPLSFLKRKEEKVDDLVSITNFESTDEGKKMIADILYTWKYYFLEKDNKLPRDTKFIICGDPLQAKVYNNKVVDILFLLENYKDIKSYNNFLGYI